MKKQEDQVPPEVDLLTISWFSLMEIYFFVSIMLGVVISAPVFMYQIYKFINPHYMNTRQKVFCLL